MMVHEVASLLSSTVRSRSIGPPSQRGFAFFEKEEDTMNRLRDIGLVGGMLIGALLVASPLARAQASDSIPAEGGDIVITPIAHASVELQFGDKVIYVDPSQGDYTGKPQGDLILITDIHGDHLVPDKIAQLRKEGAPVVAPPAVAEQAGDTVPNITQIANGETKTVAGVSIEAVPMYNLKRGPEPGQRGNGYILTLGGKRIYFAGDTACTPEMRALQNIDVAFVPMNLPYTMPPSEAAECVKAFKPKIVYPYHFRGSDLSEFSSALAGESGIEVRIRKWYPDAPPSGK
jgi:L-ascorbate metabolism protein UlaG (beta-lactamase superfamily)